MTLPASSRFQFTVDLGICRMLNGMWQASGAHGAIDPARAVEAMFAYHDAGFTTWDLRRSLWARRGLYRDLPPAVRRPLRRGAARRDPGLYEMGSASGANDAAHG